MASKLFVGNLDFKTTKEEVETLFAQVGSIRDVFIPMDRGTGRPRGFAFVEYETEEEAEQAIERFNNYELSGRALRVNLAAERPPGVGRMPFSGGGGFGSSSGGGSPFGGGGGGGGFGGGKPKGSRRNIRAKKRSL